MVCKIYLHNRLCAIYLKTSTSLKTWVCFKIIICWIKTGSKYSQLLLRVYTINHQNLFVQRISPRPIWVINKKITGNGCWPLRELYKHKSFKLITACFRKSASSRPPRLHGMRRRKIINPASIIREAQNKSTLIGRLYLEIGLLPVISFFICADLPSARAPIWWFNVSLPALTYFFRNAMNTDRLDSTAE